MQKYKIIHSTLCNMEVFKVVNLNNITVDIVYLNAVNVYEAYTTLADKYKVAH